ncbi:hypothetical protein J6590_045187 [Homalodisca vitripennis]|nr:hypothetical protein J6590_045187 [Homalodisca vitripennis]
MVVGYGRARAHRGPGQALPLVCLKGLCRRMVAGYGGARAHRGAKLGPTPTQPAGQPLKVTYEPTPIAGRRAACKYRLFSGHPSKQQPHSR